MLSDPNYKVIDEVLIETMKLIVTHTFEQQQYQYESNRNRTSSATLFEKFYNILYDPIEGVNREPNLSTVDIKKTEISPQEGMELNEVGRPTVGKRHRRIKRELRVVILLMFFTMVWGGQGDAGAREIYLNLYLIQKKSQQIK